MDRPHIFKTATLWNPEALQTNALNIRMSQIQHKSAQNSNKTSKNVMLSFDKFEHFVSVTSIMKIILYFF